jgi:hypothetical protein
MAAQNPQPPGTEIPGLDDPRQPVRPSAPRHALGLPAGSVRALLALSVLGLLGLIIFLNMEQKSPEIKTLYAYLWFMLFLIIASFFAAHGKTIRVPDVHDSSPLGLPRGSVRLILLVGFGVLVGWLYHTDRLFTEAPTVPPALILVMPLGFFTGWLVARVVRTLTGLPQGPYWFQDIEAWVAIVAMVMLLIDGLIHLVINPSIGDEHQIQLRTWEGVLAGLVSFYFGARS